ncbi:trihelix protein [Artemisia annua]|uniref:Trihelix protein n=1 Tax=Artemisia annua TaxID=35608 RepID=A0A2U1LJ28_ARTAN|nr:trihelix protein [Artemisia annua]
MMLHGAPPGLTNNPGDSPAASTQPHDTAATVSGGGAELAGSGGSGFSEDERGRIDDGGRNSGGNRWPRQETLALLKIRSDMDVAFRDSSLKGPLWDEVSRKLAELGYHRSAKKCKEKFENVYKYHKRTKEGRTSKADGKTYRFFDQLQALEGSPATPVQVSPMPNTQVPSVVIPTNVTNATGSHQNNVDPISVAAPAVTMPATMSINHVAGFPFSQLNLSVSTNSSSSSTSSDDDVAPERRRNKKRKWKEFFGKLMKEVIDKQEELQSKFLDSLERRERDRMAREEAWRMQEMAKMKREHDLLVQERSMVAAKDAAVISFLQKITEQNPTTTPPPPAVKNLDNGGGGENMLQPSPSRWPKAEINALIKLRTTLDTKYQESGPKGPLWEEISSAMRKLGYNRNAKRCKEKWENINKYYKKVKESSKKRPEDSKTQGDRKHCKCGSRVAEAVLSVRGSGFG